MSRVRESVGEAEESQGGDARVWQFEHSAGCVSCGVTDDLGVGWREALRRPEPLPAVW